MKMKIPKSLFLIFSLSLTSGLILVYAFFSNYFNRRPEVLIELEQLRAKMDKEQFEKNLLAYRLKDFQQNVALVLPKESSTLKEQQKKLAKNLDLALREPSSIPNLNLSSVIYESMKAEFKKKDFEKAIEKSAELLDKYPVSSYTVEAYFFKAESYFNLKNFKKCSDVIDLMVEQFPEHDLTGFILLRLGQIHELNNQNIEAKEIYITVADEFKNPALRSQALTMAKSLE